MSTENWIEAAPLEGAERLLRQYVDLAQPRLGAEAVFATDEFFAPRERLLRPEPARFHPGLYDDHGKWMDGWESRRRRGPGHDWCVVRLGLRGRIRALDIDTSFFTGNFPPEAAVEVCDLPELPDPSGEGADWRPLVPRRRLQGGSHNLTDCLDAGPATFLRLHIHPDGGVARLRAYGEVEIDWSAVGDGPHDLAATVNGGRAVAWNDAHFGLPANLLAPTPPENMGDGWETARRRQPGNDWCVIALGHVGVLARASLSTAFFKGNYPDRFRLRGARLGAGRDFSDGGAEVDWQELLPETHLGPDAEHEFEVLQAGPVDHVRLDIFPDGGVARLRLTGSLVR